MKAFLLFLVSASFGVLTLAAHEKANTVLIHPGEVIYARFAQSGIKLKLIKASKEKDDEAQLTLSLTATDPGKPLTGFNLKVVSRFTKDLDYEAQIRSSKLERHAKFEVYPVVAEHLSIVSMPPLVDEVALFDWKLEE